MNNSMPYLLNLEGGNRTPPRGYYRGDISRESPGSPISPLSAVPEHQINLVYGSYSEK